jgi:hypothetical protein
VVERIQRLGLQMDKLMRDAATPPESRQ